MTIDVKNGWVGASGTAPLVAWLGDDFTGAAAVMEVLSFAGLPSVLFLSAPTPARLAEFDGALGIGIASMARTGTPAWMDAHLPDLYRTLSRTGAPLVHYKICSTLDSAPGIGSVGRAIEIGLDTVGGRKVPLVVAAPPMRRYQAFGTLFAGTGDGVHRLDRHPVMSRHPVTPMDEADVARHLGRQTELPIGCIDLETLADPLALDAILSGDGPKVLTIDQMGAADEVAAGALLWERRRDNPFVVGSQGVEYALVRHWQDSGRLTPSPPPGGIGRARRMAVVSGSVSPVTAAQIAAAERAGFVPIAFDAAAACGADDALRAAEAQAADAALAALARGAAPIVHSARGPDDPAVERLRRAVGDADMAGASRRIGQALGRVLSRLIEEGEVRRAVVSGGDTSGDICTLLGIDALSALAPTVPGASLCRAHARGPMDGIEIALKGGQMGSDDYFDWIRDGGGARA